MISIRVTVSERAHTLQDEREQPNVQRAAEGAEEEEEEEAILDEVSMQQRTSAR